jgi:citrate synthase
MISQSRVDQGTSLADRFMIRWQGDPDPAHVKAIDAYWSSAAEHGMNASTFTARVVTSTLSDVYSAVTAAIGALKGPLHGGANEEVFKILEEIDRNGADPVEYIKGMLAQKQKVPGFGHRVYTTEDPRATHLRRMSRDLGYSSGQAKWFDYSKKIEEFINSEKKLNANVDFYSASTYHTLGIDIDLFTPIFAVSRIAGWAAHVQEQLSDNRLIRPRAEYIGPTYPQKYIPLESR